MFGREQEHKRQLVNSQLRRSFSEAKGGISSNLVAPQQTAASSQLTFCASSFFSCLRRSVRLMSFSMASTCRLRCFRYMPQARQYDSSSRPNLWLTVLLCISDLRCVRTLMTRPSNVASFTNLNDATFKICGSNSSACQEADRFFLKINSLQMPEEEMPYPLIG